MSNIAPGVFNIALYIFTAPSTVWPPISITPPRDVKKNGRYIKWCKPKGNNIRSANPYTNAPNTPVELINSEDNSKAFCIGGNINDNPIPTKLETIIVIAGIKRVPLKIPNTGGNCIL